MLSIFDLPRELRDQIYDDALDCSVNFPYYATMSCDCPREGPQSPVRFYYKGIHETDECQVQPLVPPAVSQLLTHRQVNVEVQEAIKRVGKRLRYALSCNIDNQILEDVPIWRSFPTMPSHIDVLDINTVFWARRALPLSPANIGSAFSLHSLSIRNLIPFINSFLWKGIKHRLHQPDVEYHKITIGTIAFHVSGHFQPTPPYPTFPYGSPGPPSMKPNPQVLAYLLYLALHVQCITTCLGRRRIGQGVSQVDAVQIFASGKLVHEINLN